MSLLRTVGTLDTAESSGEMRGRKPTFLLSERRRRSLSSEAAIMALSLEQIRRTADRVGSSHGLDVVEIEYVGGEKQRVLRVFIERNREERAKLVELARGAAPNRGRAGTSARSLD